MQCITLLNEQALIQDITLCPSTGKYLLLFIILPDNHNYILNYADSRFLQTWQQAADIIVTLHNHVLLSFVQMVHVPLSFHRTPGDIWSVHSHCSFQMTTTKADNPSQTWHLCLVLTLFNCGGFDCSCVGAKSRYSMLAVSHMTPTKRNHSQSHRQQFVFSSQDNK